MADEEHSRSAASDEDEEFDVPDDGYDDEVTLDEEEALGEGAAGADELAALEEEGEMDIEELRRRYGYGMPPETANGTTSIEEVACVEIQTEVASTSSTLNLLSYYEHHGGDDEEDKDYIPYDKKEPRVDPVLYQITVPDFCTSSNELQRDYPCTALWISSNKLEDAMLQLIQEQMKAKNPEIRLENCSMQSDNEDLLFTILQVGYDGEAALKASCENKIQHANLPINTWSRSYSPDGDCEHDVAFSNEEKQMFDVYYKEFGKNFLQIAQKFPERKMGELVEYFYRYFKRSARLEKYVHKGYIKEKDCIDVAENIRQQIKTAENRKSKDMSSLWEGTPTKDLV
ncbi:unnamed protein product, partial [Mesorhabditis belari]|uniref:ELM2 domain-containing protein n=1 Tax=Mesorhabditis belari TaxID=2138241 RepID=A0AAF3EEQ6_9BILA